MPTEQVPDWLDFTIKYAVMPWRQCLHESRIYDQRFVHSDENGRHEICMIYVPAGYSEPGDIDFGPAPGWLTDHLGGLFYQWTMAAPLMKRAIIDESLPLRAKLIGSGRWDLDGGRLAYALILGEIKYHQALHEMCEAMTHDLDSEMRYGASSAIGNMGTKARKCVPLLCERLFKDKDISVRSGVAESLGRIGDKRASAPLRDATEEARMMMHAYPRLDDYEKKSAQDWLWHYEQALRALIAVDRKSGSEAVNTGMKDRNIHVSFWAHKIGERTGILGDLFDEPIAVL